MLRYYITDSSVWPDRPLDHLLDCVEAAAASGVDWIQLREKHLSSRLLAAWAQAILQRLRRLAPRRPRLLINDRLDIALAVGADGVHLPASGLPPQMIREAYGTSLLLGQSCHSAAEVELAATAGVNFCVLGPIYSTPSKLGMGPPLGVEVFRQLRPVGIPVLALGGLTEARAQECLSAGASGIAAIRLFQEVPGGGVRVD